MIAAHPAYTGFNTMAVFPDFRLTLRGLRRTPAFTIAAVSCLALGIGATTAIFSVVNAVLLRPLPYAASENLARLYTEWPTWPGGGMYKFWTSGPEFLELRRDLKSWETLDAWQAGGVNVAGSSEPVRATGCMASGTLFKTLGVQPILGRLIDSADDQFGAPLGVLMSENLWRRQFGADPRILSREIQVDGRKANVLGVMPASFQFPPGEADPVELWIPMQLNPASPGGRGGHRYYLLGRLKSDVTVSQANQELKQYVHAVGARSGEGGPHSFNPKTHTLAALPLQSEVTGSVRPALWAMFAAVGFVLLIACGNVANLLLARAETRQREIAVRRAMGASTWALVRQFLIEGILIASGGAIAGFAFVWLVLRLIVHAAGSSLPRAHEVGPDWRVFGFAALLALATGVFFGLAPLVQSLPRAVADSLKAAGARTTATRGAHLLRRLLVASQMALALVLLIGAGMMIESFWKLQRVDTGLRPENVVTMSVSLPRSTYSDPARRAAFWRSLDAKLQTLPGAASAGIVGGLPPIRPINANDTQFEGFKQVPGGPIQSVDYWNAATPGYFSTLGIQLLEGRFFTENDVDGAPPVLIVNQALARVFYPGESPIGKRIRPGFDGPWMTVVGVAANVRNAGVDKPAATELYFPFHQTTIALGATVVARTAGGSPGLVNTIRAAVREIDPTLPVSNIRLMEDVISRAQARPRFLTLLIALFSAVALALAALGVYSVMAYSVTQRTSEFGIRMAMGAEGRHVLRLVLRQAVLLAVAGIFAGAAGAAALVRVVRGAVYGIDGLQPFPFLVMALLLAAVTLAACLGPALRATRVDPLVALRYE